VLPEQLKNPQEQEPVPLRVSAIVVSHNRAELLRRCLGALERSEGREAIQVILVDNGSTDGSAALEPEFPNVRFLRLPRNFGLTKALNIGIRAAEAEYVLFLHEDTELAPTAVRELAHALDTEPEAGAVCPLLVDCDGRPAPQMGTLPPDGRWEPAEAAAETLAVPYATGAALMVRSFFLKAMRHVDERYGQFGSDAELCFKIRSGGKKILLVSAARAVHIGREGDSEARIADFKLGRAVYLAKHSGFFAGLGARIVDTFAALGAFQFGRFFDLISGQKIDGTQKNA
jgi:GT2 family glycosyltransferase